MAEGVAPLAGRPGEAEDEVLADDVRLVRWAGPAFVLFSVILLPWSIYLGFSLPSRQLSPHYDIALLVVDAWFDNMTSPRRQLPEAIILAVFIELPLAALCAWLSYHTQHLEERRVVLLLRRRRMGRLRPSQKSLTGRWGHPRG